LDIVGWKTLARCSLPIGRATPTRHVFETVVGDGLDEGLVENKAELISRSR
jgi:hypothetical protein